MLVSGFAGTRLTILVCCIVTFCSAQDKTPRSTSVANDTGPDQGSISGNLYSNKFFDLAFEFPKDWIPHGEATKQHLMDIGKDKLIAVAPGRESEIKIAEKHAYNLLTVFENELGTPGVKFFRSEILMAEDVSWAPGIKTGEDYLLNVQPLLKKGGYDRFSEIKPVEIGGRTFYREDLSKQERPDIRGYQAYFATIARGYALSLIISTEDPDETAKLAASPVLRFGPNLAAIESRSRAPDRRGMASSPQESGSLSSGTYHNSYFGITYSLPRDWYVDTNIFRERLDQSNDKESDPAKKSYVLLSANEFAPGTPGITFNPSLAVMADLVVQSTRPLTGKDYLPKITKGLLLQYHGELIQEGAEIAVGGQNFYRADYRRLAPAVSYQAVICTVWKGYLLVWTFVAKSSSQLDDLVASIRHVSFEKENPVQQ